MRSNERFLTVDGSAGKLRVSDGGEGGVPVVFVHGLGSDLEVWRAQLDHLRPARRALALDLRGHGGSEPAKGGVYTIPTLASDVDAVVSRLGLQRFILVGHSMAGAVLTAYAGRHPEKVVGLVYVDAVGDVSGAPPEMKAMFTHAPPNFGPEQLRAAYGEMIGPVAKPGTRAQVLASADRMGPNTFLALRRALADYVPTDDIKRYTGPRRAIEVAGVDMPFTASRSLPNVTRTTLPNVSHWLMLDDPEGFNRELDAALANIK